MAPSRSRLPDSCVQAGRKLAVKQRPDQYCTKMVDMPRLGRRGLIKAIRLGNKEIAKYMKDDKVKYSDVSVGGLEDKTKANNVENVQQESVVNKDPFITHKSFVDETKPDDNDETDLFLSDSDVIEGETSENNCLGLDLSESDVEVYDEQENDTFCNLVEIPIPLRRICLLKSSKRREKLKYGFSKFESRHDTLNLDRFFFFKPMKIKAIRRWRGNVGENVFIPVNTSDIVTKGAMCKGEVAVNEAIGDNIIVLAKNMNINDNIPTLFKKKENFVLIDQVQELGENVFVEAVQDQPNDQDTEVPAEVTQVVEDILEVVFSKISHNKCDPNREEKSVSNIFESVFGSSISVSTDGLVQLENVCVADTNDDANVVMDTGHSKQISYVTQFSRCLLVQFRLSL